jgi:hypothetical protein
MSLLFPILSTDNLAEKDAIYGGQVSEPWLQGPFYCHHWCHSTIYHLPNSAQPDVAMPHVVPRENCWWCLPPIGCYSVHHIYACAVDTHNEIARNVRERDRSGNGQTFMIMISQYFRGFRRNTRKKCNVYMPQSSLFVCLGTCGSMVSIYWLKADRSWDALPLRLSEESWRANLSVHVFVRVGRAIDG